MEWTKRVGARAGLGGWREDFPLDVELPSELTIDLGSLEAPVHPMFVVRLAVFEAWHRQAGRGVRILPPRADGITVLLSSLGLSFEEAGPPNQAATDVALPLTRLQDHADVELAGSRVQELVQYQLGDVGHLHSACFMAISELGGNAVEHGANPLGAFVVAIRADEPRPLISIALGDLGIGVPEHLRQRYPEWLDDGFAIARALEPRVTGTGHPHRGNGFTETFNEALAAATSAARIDVISATGFVRREVVQERVKTEAFPAPSRRRGTWITFDIVSA